MEQNNDVMVEVIDNKKVFSIDVGNLPIEDATEYLVNAVCNLRAVLD